jgi:hypothetical protein
MPHLCPVYLCASSRTVGRQLAADMKSSAHRATEGPMPAAVSGHKEAKSSGSARGKPHSAGSATGQAGGDPLLEMYKRRRKKGSAHSWGELMPAGLSTTVAISEHRVNRERSAEDIGATDMLRSLSEALSRYDYENHSLLRSNESSAMFPISYLGAEVETLSLQDIPRYFFIFMPI